MPAILHEGRRGRLRGGVLTALTLALAACDKPIVLAARHGLGAPSRATPLVADGLVVLGHDRGLTLAEPSGKLRCNAELGGAVEGRPALAGKRVVAATLSGRVVGLDESCKLAWSADVGGRVRADLAVALGRVLVASYDRRLHAFSPRRGERVWTFPEPGLPPLAGELGGSGPVVEGDTVYVGDLAGSLHAVDSTSGAPRWRHHLGASQSAPVVATRGAVFAGSDDGVLTALVPPGAPGGEPTTRWQLRTEAAHSPAARLAEGTLYVASFDRHVYAVEAETGRVLWRRATRGPLLRAPVDTDDLVLVAAGSGDGSLYALDRATGAELWHHATGGAVVAEPALAGSRVWLASTDASAYVFDLRPRPSTPAAVRTAGP